MKAEMEVMHAWLSCLEQVMHDVSLGITKNMWDGCVNYALIHPNILLFLTLSMQHQDIVLQEYLKHHVISLTWLEMIVEFGGKCLEDILFLNEVWKMVIDLFINLSSIFFWT